MVRSRPGQNLFIAVVLRWRDQLAGDEPAPFRAHDRRRGDLPTRIVWLHDEFRRRIKMRNGSAPFVETGAILFWALLASGQVNMRKNRRLAGPRQPLGRQVKPVFDPYLTPG